MSGVSQCLPNDCFMNLLNSTRNFPKTIKHLQARQQKSSVWRLHLNAFVVVFAVTNGKDFMLRCSRFQLHSLCFTILFATDVNLSGYVITEGTQNLADGVPKSLFTASVVRSKLTPPRGDLNKR